MTSTAAGDGDEVSATAAATDRTVAGRRTRSDALRNVDAVLEAAAEVFAVDGVSAPVRQIAARAGVGVGTVYRHYPQRSDLISAVFRREVDACAEAAAAVAAQHPPGEALELWLQRYTDFIATKRGLAAALHSGDTAFDALPGYFDQHFEPVLSSLLSAASEAGAVRTDVAAHDLLRAVANLCLGNPLQRPGHPGRMVALLVDGLRYGAETARGGGSTA